MHQIRTILDAVFSDEPSSQQVPQPDDVTPLLTLVLRLSSAVRYNHHFQVISPE